MIKLKVIKISTTEHYSYRYDDDCYHSCVYDISNWQEVSDEDYQYLHQRINELNTKSIRTHKDFRYQIILESTQDEIAQYIEDGKLSIEKMRLQQEEFQRKEKERKENAKLTAKEKKMKQLEKLKKELGV